ncbi:hypothetical protein AVEN_122507-1 [Araneus ventricosus]|uniref:Uncharacterized protein n=1 Tax=Araneus ventricosus TaxID=182803 RepID=A0A4Y2RJZ3_ARAVE|nr:hypothetical protein AVEN_163727-1 [Araneus ventricosus]GBN75243.1 hypothetical protein AVEN_122507-1 [Araneus ventricosus]
MILIKTQEKVLNERKLVAVHNSNTEPPRNLMDLFINFTKEFVILRNNICDKIDDISRRRKICPMIDTNEIDYHEQTKNSSIRQESVNTEIKPVVNTYASAAQSSSTVPVEGELQVNIPLENDK